MNATTSFASYNIDFGKANQLPINLVLKNGQKGNSDSGQSVAVIVQLSSDILSISVTLPTSFNKKVAGSASALLVSIINLFLNLLLYSTFKVVYSLFNEH